MKLLISTVPWTDTESPIMAPALLKSMCVQKGIPTVAVDLNQVVINFVRENFDSEEERQLQEFFYDTSKNANIKSVSKTINYIVDKILEHNATHVALSLLTYTSQVACEWICFQVRRKAPEVKIIIGGAGVFNTLNSKTNFGEKLLQQKQIDYYIKGDGDVSLPDLILKDTKSIGVNQIEWKQVDNLNGLPFPFHVY